VSGVDLTGWAYQTRGMSVNMQRPVTGSLSVRTAAQIRAVMAYYGTTPTEVARRIGKSAQWMSVRMRGQQPIDLDDLDLIAGALGVAPDELLPRAGEVTRGYPHGSRLSHSGPVDRRPPGRPGGTRGPSGPARTARVHTSSAA